MMDQLGAWTWGFCPRRGDTAFGCRGWRWAADTGRKDEWVRAGHSQAAGVGPGVLPPSQVFVDIARHSLVPSAFPSGSDPQDSGELVSPLHCYLGLEQGCKYSLIE